jgi:hypothetical protein
VKLNRKVLLAGAGLALMAGSVTFVGTSLASAASAPSPGSLHCTSISGTLKFTPPLATNGSTTGSETTAFKGKLGNCTASGTGAKTPTKGTVSSSTTTNNGNKCSNFASGAANSGTTFAIKWAPGSIAPTSITFPPGDIMVTNGGSGFTLQGSPSKPVTGSGSYPGTDSFKSSVATATTNVNLETGLCQNGKPQKTIKITGGDDKIG